MDDTKLIQRILTQSDDYAITALIRNHQTRIMNFMYRLTAGDHATSADLTQETFIIMVAKLGTFRSESSFSTWLHKIAYRCFLKTLKQGRVDSLDHDVHDKTSMEVVESNILVGQLMSQLKEAERVCLTLFYSAGMTHPEVVEVTGMPLGTVKTNIMRGKKKLAALMNSNGKEEGR